MESCMHGLLNTGRVTPTDATRIRSMLASRRHMLERVAALSVEPVRDCVGCAYLDAPVCSEPCATCAMYASRPHWKARAQAEGGGE